jgi:hypothetical protein
MVKAPTFDRTRETVAEVAEYVCACFAEGSLNVVKLNHISFELSDVARCSEFVRECVECAWGCGDHQLSTSASHPVAGPWFSGTARETEKLLKEDGKQKGIIARGDVLCFNKGNAGEFGHIGIALGNGRFAENTSSTKRGPGFVISSFGQIGDRISGVYSVGLPGRAVAVPHNPPLLVTTAGKVIAEGKVFDGVLWTPTRATVEACGGEVKWDAEQGKAYLVKWRAK